MTQVSNVQKEALAALDTFSDGMWIPTSSLNADGISTVTLRSLFEADLVDSQKTREAKYWQITSAGRAALSSAT